MILQQRLTAIAALFASFASFASFALLALSALSFSACGAREASLAAPRQTGFPGQISAGGGTSGQVLTHNGRPKTSGETTGGTPFHAGGAEGNTGGTATAGTVQESGQGPSGKQPPPDQNAKTAPSK